MEKLKLLFQQTLMISTGILFAIGVEGIVAHLTGSSFGLGWYDPLAIIFVGFLCALPTLLLIMTAFAIESSRRRFKWIVFLHCMAEFAIVSVAGWIFHWYSTLKGYLVIVIMYFAVYIFAWAGNIWIYKIDESKINHALKNIQDEE